ncbi:MAG: cytochrome B5 [Clostridiales bacterium]|nr:cytochrome B5 [Clostridiales bacterium]
MPGATEPKVFTAAELAKYDGLNGNPAYVAVDGIVYDVSAVPQWSNGSHAGGTLRAGLDQTDALARSPHGAKNLVGLPVVGVYQ